MEHLSATCRHLQNIAISFTAKVVSEDATASNIDLTVLSYI
jgi:hypothetical protein